MKAERETKGQNSAAAAPHKPFMLMLYLMQYIYTGLTNVTNAPEKHLAGSVEGQCHRTLAVAFFCMPV